MPEARDLAEALGYVPSRNKIMATLRVGAPKASALREALIAEAAESDTRPDRWALAEPAAALAPVSPAPAGVPATDPGPPARVGTDPGAEPAQPGALPVSRAGAVAPSSDTAESPAGVAAITPVTAFPQDSTAGHPGTPAVRYAARRVSVWPVLLIALPAAVAIWSGWVGLGELAGFGVVHPLPGIADGVALNTAITLPVGVEAYAAYALRAWLSGRVVGERARRFAKWSGIGSLLVGALGQVAYHLLAAAGVTAAPWPITTAVACLPVAVLGMAAALADLMRAENGGYAMTSQTPAARTAVTAT
ncbi:ABC transporter permease [Couchioplanes caeruleus]|uniref:ABC transporter permease n=1 Tax=Couchioplanes caeruleus TaxID=56438 RepID=UPI003D3179A3